MDRFANSFELSEILVKKDRVYYVKIWFKKYLVLYISTYISYSCISYRHSPFFQIVARLGSRLY